LDVLQVYAAERAPALLTAAGNTMAIRAPWGATLVMVTSP
jgi:hypothetical protein